MQTYFLYEIRLQSECELFQLEPLNIFTNAGEVTLTSRHFTDYDVCATSANGAVLSLLKKLEKATSTRYVLTSKMNPMHDDTAEEHEMEGWSKTTVMRIYVADADELKKNKIKFSIHANIGVDQEYVKMLHTMNQTRFSQ